MQQRQWAGRLDAVSQLVHGVGADQQQIGATGLQAPCGVNHVIAQRIPVAVMLQLLDRGEVHRPQQQLRRMCTTEALPHVLVDEPVVLGRAFPAHAADQAKGLHALLQARDGHCSTDGSGAAVHGRRHL